MDCVGCEPTTKKIRMLSALNFVTEKKLQDRVNFSRVSALPKRGCECFASDLPKREDHKPRIAQIARM
jgi:hypothetical protein